MSLVAKYGLDKFVSALYYKDPAHRFIELGKLGFNQLLLVAKHFGVKEIYRKDDPEIIVDINELIEMELLQREVKIANRLTIESLQKELGEHSIQNYYDWSEQFKKKPDSSLKSINTLGINESKFKSYMKIWKKNNLAEVQHQ